MKVSIHVQKNLVRRARSYNSRIRNHHISRSRIRGASSDNSSKRRGATDAHGSDSFCSYCSALAEQGSVTAEFAMILPAVLLIMVLALGVLGTQSSRMQLIELAAESSRAIARGEPESTAEQLIRESGLAAETESSVTYSDLMICVELTQSLTLPVLGGLLAIPLAEKQCSRKSGL